MAGYVAGEHSADSETDCWCCGRVENPARMVHLGNHPEVNICTGCARWIGKSAGEIDDRDRTGVTVQIRGGLRAVRNRVVEHGWHRSAFFGPCLRWIGRHTP